MASFLNLGILAHVDAGKTSLTERLLVLAGIIDQAGSVDAGTTQTDSLALERQRGITIRSSVVSFEIDCNTVNLIDTPGHPDFIAEVERALRVLDGVVLVISAVEGVQAQTRVLMRVLGRLGIPVVLFVNKIDRRGARYGSLLDEIRSRLASSVVPMGTVSELGSPAAAFVPGMADDAAEALAERDESLFAAVAYDRSISDARVARVLAEQTRAGLVHPVFFGSAVTGAGVPELMAQLPVLLGVAPAERGLPPEAGETAFVAEVFAVQRDPGGQRVAVARVRQGQVRERDRVSMPGGGRERVTGVGVYAAGGVRRLAAGASAGAGQIVQLRGLSSVRIGDVLGADLDPADALVEAPVGERGTGELFAPPLLETVVVPVDSAQRGELRAALAELADQDPLIGLAQDDERQELRLSLYGEVQKEVIAATLAAEYGVQAEFRSSVTICIERLAGPGAAVEIIGTDSNPLLATVGLRVEPGPVGSGVKFGLEVEPGSMPAAFFNAVQETLPVVLRRGGRFGWEVRDVRVTMTHSGYWARQSHSHAVFDKSMSSTAGDFRALTEVVLRRAIADAGTVVHEPFHQFTLEVPAELLGVVLPLLGSAGSLTEGAEVSGATAIVTGELPASSIHGLRLRLPGLTGGEALLDTGFSRYRPAAGNRAE